MDELTVKETAELLGCSIQTVRYYIRAHRLNARKLPWPDFNAPGGGYRISREEVERFRKNRQDAA